MAKGCDHHTSQFIKFHINNYNDIVSIYLINSMRGIVVSSTSFKKPSTLS